MWFRTWLLAHVPYPDFIKAMLHDLNRLATDLEYDTRNVLLTFTRIWSTLETSAIRSKPAAADWVKNHLPKVYQPVIARAKSICMGLENEYWDDLKVLIEPCADFMVDKIKAKISLINFDDPKNLITLVEEPELTMTNHDKILIDISLVKTLIAEQFPEWADLEIKPVKSNGWDNKTFHLGRHMTVRLPTHAQYANQVEKEQYWLPKLAPKLPLPIAMPLKMGKPGPGYPFHWSVYKWLEGNAASTERIANINEFAKTLAEFLTALQQCDATDGPPAGEHNFYRGDDLAVYAAETREAIKNLDAKEYTQAVTEVWDLALASTWQYPPVWVHGDIAIGNLLVNHGQLSSVIDFGQLGVGDPACDLVIAWTLFTSESRNAFRAALHLDKNTWERGRGWALWKALCWAFPGEKRIDWRVIDEILADHQIDKATFLS